MSISIILFTKHFEALWSTLKQFETVWTVGAGTVWSSLKLTGAKHSITWHNFEASRRRDSTSACLVSTSSTCTIVTARITLWNSYVAKNRICKCQKKTCLQHLATAHFRNLEDKWPSIKNHQTRSDSNHTKAISNHTKHYTTLPQKAWHSRSWSWRQEKSIVFEFIKLS